MFKIEAAQRLAVMAGIVKTTNSKYAFQEFFVDEGFKVQHYDPSSYLDGFSAAADGKNKDKALAVWTKAAKRLAPNFKAVNPEYSEGTWTDDQSQTKWKVYVETGAAHAVVRFCRVGAGNSELLQFKERDI